MRGRPQRSPYLGQKAQNLRDQKEALDRIANFDVEKARIVVPELVELYKDTKKPEHLEALARLSGRAHQAPHIEALEYSEDDFDRATMAAGDAWVR